jgi:hypothetical protein
VANRTIESRKARQDNREEWEDIGKGPLMDGIYSTLRHRCGTVVNIAQGCLRVCPRCNPEERDKERGAL